MYEPPVFDSDGDVLTDRDELERYGNDPLIVDANTDTDGIEHSEKEDIEADTDPNDPTNYPITSTHPEGINGIDFLGRIAIPSFFI